MIRTYHAALSEALGQTVTLAREAGISHLDAGPLNAAHDGVSLDGCGLYSPDVE